MGNAVAQTLYAGKRPNLICIYNKLAEWLMQLKKRERDCRRFNAGMAEMEMSPEQMHYGVRFPSTFEEFCMAEGYEYRDGNILTRIERQIGGSRFPPELATFNDLRFAHELIPFKDLRLISSEPIRQLETPPDGASMRNWLAALGLESLREQVGSLQVADSIVRKHGKGNGGRILESLADCLPKPREPLTMEEVQESFRKSTLLQTSHCDQADVH